MLNTYKNPDVSSIPIQGWVLDLVLFFFFFPFLLVSVFLPGLQEKHTQNEPSLQWWL